MSNPHPNDPLHGITLKTVVTELHGRYGWETMADRIPIRCFQINPSINSSLTFLRKTPWAREKVEKWFIQDARHARRSFDGQGLQPGTPCRDGGEREG